MEKIVKKIISSVMIIATVITIFGSNVMTAEAKSRSKKATKNYSKTVSQKLPDGYSQNVYDYFARQAFDSVEFWKGTTEEGNYITQPIDLKMEPRSDIAVSFIPGEAYYNQGFPNIDVATAVFYAPSGPIIDQILSDNCVRSILDDGRPAFIPCCDENGNLMGMQWFFRSTKPEDQDPIWNTGFLPYCVTTDLLGNIYSVDKAYYKSTDGTYVTVTESGSLAGIYYVLK